MVARVPEEQPDAWEPMLLSHSFGIDALTKWDGRVLTRDTSFIGKPQIDRQPEEDWDAHNLNADPPTMGFDKEILPPPSGPQDDDLQPIDQGLSRLEHAEAHVVDRRRGRLVGHDIAEPEARAAP